MSLSFVFVTLQFLVLVPFALSLPTASGLTFNFVRLPDKYIPFQLPAPRLWQFHDESQVTFHDPAVAKGVPNNLPTYLHHAGPPPVEKATQPLGYVALYDGSIQGGLLGYMNGHRVVHTKADAVKYSEIDLQEFHELYNTATHERVSISAGHFGDSLAIHSKNFHVTRLAKPRADNPNSSTRSTRVRRLSDDEPMFETAVYGLDNTANEVLVSWTNPDGTRPTTYVVINDDRIYYTGDVAALRAAVTQDFTLVALKWVPAT
ncbi:hypothetical protein CYLTODRAFT_452344 [Cylindrobasidium torrendii FP15055 ss-10]|uniref:Uncharacterized protein n=1 Tax=Cylindrobasidium torrendii FP15055 ss-10 TaxID=1314674 RepID=A0A0D7BI29_9AGAR|nr:hypothetical protein CYLTODRAFT_452344 [Cylindrobasidium torrendii FP15055 ss-10]